MTKAARSRYYHSLLLYFLPAAPAGPATHVRQSDGRVSWTYVEARRPVEPLVPDELELSEPEEELETPCEGGERRPAEGAVLGECSDDSAPAEERLSVGTPPAGGATSSISSCSRHQSVRNSLHRRARERENVCVWCVIEKTKDTRGKCRNVRGMERGP